MAQPPSRAVPSRRLVVPSRDARLPISGAPLEPPASAIEPAVSRPVQSVAPDGVSPQVRLSGAVAYVPDAAVQPKPQQSAKVVTAPPSYRAPQKPSQQQISERLGRTARRTSLLQAFASSDDTRAASQTPKRRVWFGRQFATGMAVAAILAVTGYVSVDTWMTNQQIKTDYVAAQGVGLHEAPSDDTDHSPHREGKDEAIIPVDLIKNYRVAADEPRVLTIPSLSIEARLMNMGVNDDGSMQAPINIFDAGWYNGSSKPGELGAVVVNAHASGPTRQGLFGYLDTLKKGDQVVIETGSGADYIYEVVASENVALDKVDMQKLMLPYGDSNEGLNLITCVGEWVSQDRTFDHRHIVYAKRVE